jgi:hypothetical protein
MCSSRIIEPKPDASANAPWTRTMVGADAVVMTVDPLHETTSMGDEPTRRDLDT